MSARIAHICVDAVDAAALAAFWSQVLDQPVDEGASPYYAGIGIADRQPGRTAMMFLMVPEPPSGTKNRVHVDLVADGDLAAETARVVALGATHVGDFDEYGTTWASFTDPEGNAFDIAVAGAHQ
ncbi:VOC family protein [Euzebya sp.]|uniref:VOC family protein n=1 Tax=Euzebya sp. TaxID=1971409 RepID=UPI003510DED0